MKARASSLIFCAGVLVGIALSVVLISGNFALGFLLAITANAFSAMGATCLMRVAVEKR